MKIANPEDRRTTLQRLWVLLTGMILSVACATGSSVPSLTPSTSLELEISSEWPALAPGVTTGETSGVAAAASAQGTNANPPYGLSVSSTHARPALSRVMI